MKSMNERESSIVFYNLYSDYDSVSRQLYKMNVDFYFPFISNPPKVLSDSGPHKVTMLV